MFEVGVIYKAMKFIEFLEELFNIIMLEFYWTEFMGIVPQCFWPLREVAHTSNNCWMNTFMDIVYLGIIESCRYKMLIYSEVDDSTVCRCDYASTHVCGNNSSSKVFFLNDYCTWSRLLAIWLWGVSNVCYWLFGI